MTGGRVVSIGFLILILLAVAALAGCGGEDDGASRADETVKSTGTGEAEESSTLEVPDTPVDVRLAIGPYLDESPQWIARELGLDEEVGLKLDISVLPSTGDALRGLRRGSLDMAYSCHACIPPVAEEYPELRGFQMKTEFKGYVVVGRRGQTDTFDELVESGMSQEDAKMEILNSFRGRTFTLAAVTYAPVVRGALEAVGLPGDEVKFQEFPNDAQAGLAFLRGTGDYFLGSLPQMMKLLLDNEDDFVEVGGHSILGPGALFYVNVVANEDWLRENRETALRFSAMWYRAVRYINEQPETALPIMTQFINDEAAAGFSEEEVAFIIERFIGFPTVEYASEHQYNPSDTELYWEGPAKFLFEQQRESLPDDFTYEDFKAMLQEEEFFNELKEREDLMAWINSPL